MPYRIAPDRSDIRAFTTAEAGTRFSLPGGMQDGLDLLVGYIPRWYTRPKTVTHPSTNRARRALTSFMRRTPLTTTPRRVVRVLSPLLRRIGCVLPWRSPKL